MNMVMKLANNKVVKILVAGIAWWAVEKAFNALTKPDTDAIEVSEVEANEEDAIDITDDVQQTLDDET